MKEQDRHVLLSFLRGGWSPDHELRADQFGAWLTDHGLLEEDVTVTPQDLRDAARLRSALLACLTLNQEGEIAEEARAELKVVAHSLPLCVTMDGRADLKLQPAGQGVSAAFSRILALAYRAWAEGEFSRFKICQRCGHAFIDKSKNRSAVWCTMARCGSQEKSRAYRARKREGVAGA